MIPAIPFGIGTAIYTAFLFGQAEGRDLWQSPLLPIHMLIQSIMGGSAFLLVMGAFIDFHFSVVELVQTTFLVSVGLDLAVTLLGEFGMPHASEQAGRAAHMITKGRYAKSFWGLAIVLGHIVPLFMGFYPAWIAGLLVLVGLYAFEHAYVTAPQELPNS